MSVGSAIGGLGAASLMAAAAWICFAEPHRIAGSADFVESPGGFEARAATYLARVSRDGDLSIAAARGAPVELRTASFGRGGGHHATRGQVRLEGGGLVVIHRGEAVERFRADAAGVEQSFEVPSRPRGEGDLIARIAVRGGERAGSTPDGVRLAAGDGRGFVYDHATWIDARGVKTALAPTFDGHDIVVRVDAALVERSAYPAVLDPTVGPENDIATHGTSPWRGRLPAIACGTSGCLAVWESSDALLDGIAAVHVRGDGTLIDPSYFSASRSNGEFPRVAWDGTSYLVTYATSASPSHSFARQVGDSPMSGADLSLEMGAATSGPSVARLAAGFVTVWEENGVTRGRLVDDSGTLGNPLINPPVELLSGIAGTAMDVTFGFYANGPTVQSFGAVGAALGAPVQLSSSTQASGPLVAAMGSTKLAVWSDSGLGRIMGSIVPGPPFSIAAAGASQQLAVTSDGTSFWVAIMTLTSNSTSTLSAVPIDVSGNVGPATPPVDLLATPATFGAGCDTSGCMALFSDDDVLIQKLRFGAQNDTAPTPLGVSDLATGSPRIESDGVGYLSLFTDNTRKAFVAEHLDAGGARLDELSCSVIDTAEPVLAFDGQAYRVSWSDGASDEIDRIPNLGGPGDILKLYSGNQQQYPLKYAAPGIACGPSDCLVVDGTETVSAIEMTDMLGVEIKKVGEGGRGARVAWGGGRYYAAWNSFSAAVGALIDPASGSSMPSQAIGHGSVNATPAVAFDGANFVVAWSEISGNGANIRAARVDLAQKRLGAPATIAVTSPNPNVALTALRDGATTLLAWQNGAHSSSTCFARYAGGIVVDKPTCVDADGDSTSLPAVAARAQGHALIAYVRTDTRPGYLADRVKTRTIDFGDAIGAACETGHTCTSSFCSDGVCCDAACDGDCRHCNAQGRCEPVTSGEDPDTCIGRKTCDADGRCVAKLGGECNNAADCSKVDDKQTYCVTSDHKSVCCLAQCGPCETCGDNGICRAVSCAAGVLCSKETNACPDVCASTLDCPEGQVCGPDGRCDVAPPPQTAFSDCTVSREGEEGGAPFGAAALLGGAAAALSWRRRRARKRALA